MEKIWTVYILECGDGTLYTGITDDLERRLRAHETGKGAKYTRGRGPLTLVHTEEVEDKSAALKREHSIKKLSRAEKRVCGFVPLADGFSAVRRHPFADCRPLCMTQVSFKEAWLWNNPIG